MRETPQLFRQETIQHGGYEKPVFGTGRHLPLLQIFAIPGSFQRILAWGGRILLQQLKVRFDLRPQLLQSCLRNLVCELLLLGFQFLLPLLFDTMDDVPGNCLDGFQN